MNEGRDQQKLIEGKNWLFQSPKKSGNLQFAILNSLTGDISNAITSSKVIYHERLSKNSSKTLLENTKNICKMVVRFN